MDKPKIFACFEISSLAVKMVVGYEKDNNPVILYTKSEPIEGIIVDGRIADRAALIGVLKQFKNIDDKEKKIKLNITEAYLILPPFGLAVYQNNKTTNVVSYEGIITKTDISNVISLVNKEEVPNGNLIVDIIPDEFVLDNGERFIEPPISQRSQTLTIKAKVHALPADIISSYTSVMNDAGYRIKKNAVSSYCYAELFSHFNDLPKTFILLDIGARLSTLSFIGEGSAYSSTYFTKGGEDLTDAIVDATSASVEIARQIKEDYGYSTKEHIYNPPLYLGTDEAKMLQKPFYQQDLNKLIIQFIDNYIILLNTSLQTLLQPYGGRFTNIPIVVTGGGSSLYGFNDLLENKLTNHDLIFVKNKSVGATEPTYSALLGMINIASRYKGSLVDNQHGVRSVMREGTMNSKQENTNNNEDEI